jgi:hypothetical protein
MPLLTWQDLQPGDLLFQDLDCGELCEAIERVTPGWRGFEVTHVGIVVLEGYGASWELQVLEAIGANVHVTPLDQFLARTSDNKGRPKVFVGRLRESEALAPWAETFARSYLGRPYDSVFAPNDDALYCSELVSLAYNAAKELVHGPDAPLLFPPGPMTFTDPATHQIFPPWQQYYDELKLPVPEGEAGSNPGALSLSKQVQIIGRFGLPDRQR